MKIQNKLLIVNLTVFLLFVATFSLFYYSEIRLMNLKNLEKETIQLRGLILRVEYANNALLHTTNMPLNVLKRTYDSLNEELEVLIGIEGLHQLDELTAKKIRDNYDFLKSQNFELYFSSIFKDIFDFRFQMNDSTIEMIYLDWKNGIFIDRELYDKIMAVRFRIMEFSSWYHPFTEQFKTITEEILDTISSQIRLILIQTGITLMLSLLVSMTVILLTYRNMIGKITRVRLAIELLSRGNLSTRIQIKSNDELSSIGDNFNAMTETISQKLNSIGSIIHNIGQSLTENPDLGHLENTILQLAIENTRAESGAFYRVEKDKRILVPAHRTSHFALPYDESLYREGVPYGKTILGKAAVSGEPFFVKNTDGQNLVPLRSSLERNYISSCIILPLVSERELTGIICLEKNNDTRFRDMDYSNILSFIEFSAVTLKNLEKYTELLQSTGLNREMQIASDIQKSLLPPRIPDVSNIDISVNTYSVRGISGDIYDFFQVDQGKWLFCMAEVMEQGIASSMMLVILRTLIRILVRKDQDPGELLTILLRNFTETTGLETAVHINLCLMEPEKRCYSYCGTENQKILLYKNCSDSLNLLESPKPVNQNYQSIKGVLENRDSLALMTDGFYNAQNANGESYGWKPLMRILKKYKTRSSSWLQDALVKDISFFEKAVEQQDDRTLFIARYKETDK